MAIALTLKTTRYFQDPSRRSTDCKGLPWYLIPPSSLERYADTSSAHNELELGSKILERVAGHQQLLAKDEGESSRELTTLTATYLTYRITLVSQLFVGK